MWNIAGGLNNKNHNKETYHTGSFNGIAYRGVLWLKNKSIFLLLTAKGNIFLVRVHITRLGVR